MKNIMVEKVNISDLENLLPNLIRNETERGRKTLINAINANPAAVRAIATQDAEFIKGMEGYDNLTGVAGFESKIGRQVIARYKTGMSYENIRECLRQVLRKEHEAMLADTGRLMDSRITYDPGN